MPVVLLSLSHLHKTLAKTWHDVIVFPQNSGGRKRSGERSVPFYDLRDKLRVLLNVRANRFGIRPSVVLDLLLAELQASRFYASSHLKGKLYLPGTFLRYLLLAKRFCLAEVARYRFPVSSKRV